jgi:predicted nucleic acid-binding protein
VVIVDSTVWIDFLTGAPTPQTDWLDREVGRRRLGVTDIILCEVLQGIRDDRRFDEVRAQLLGFHLFEMGGIELAVATARNYRRLRARGRTVRTTIDGLIATFCLLNDHELLHNDRDFDAFEDLFGLRIVHP